MPARPIPIEQRLWSRITKTASCWLYTGATDKDGYGALYWKRAEGTIERRAHRIAWILTYGDIPEDKVVCHNCPDGDNPTCINPAHLWLGTIGDNTRDAIAKGRKPIYYHLEAGQWSLNGYPCCIDCGTTERHHVAHGRCEPCDSRWKYRQGPQHHRPIRQPGQRKQGRWAMHFDACIDCGTTERAHKTHGRCTTCAGKHYQRTRKPRTMHHRMDFSL